MDTSALVELERRGLTVRDLEPDLATADLVIAAVTASELLVGVNRANSPERRRRREEQVEALFVLCPPIPFDLAIARVHAQLVSQLRPAGVVIGAHDLQIAATALAGGHEVVTANEREFRRVPGLVVRKLPVES